MTGRVAAREVQARILDDLGRGHRSISAIAERHHVPAEAVFMLRDKYGPGLPGLTAAAKSLRRPPALALSKHPPAAPEVVAEVVAEVCPTRKPAKAFPKGGGYTDGLTSNERAACKDWAVAQGWARPIGPCSRALIARWDAAGRPSSPIKTSENDEDPMETAPGPLNDLPQDCPAPDSVLDDVVVDDVVDVEIAALWDDWDVLMARAEGITAVVREWDGAIQAVEMLRDALAEHDHREQLVAKLAAFLGRHQHLDHAQLAAAILDEIEAA